MMVIIRFLSSWARKLYPSLLWGMLGTMMLIVLPHCIDDTSVAIDGHKSPLTDPSLQTRSAHDRSKTQVKTAYNPSKRVLTHQIIQEMLPSFKAQVNKACIKCAQAACIPSCMRSTVLGSLNMRRVRLCPYLEDFKKNSVELTASLKSQESIDFINQMVKEFYHLVALKKPKASEERELIFHDLIDKKIAEGLSREQHVAVGFAYCWAFNKLS